MTTRRARTRRLAAVLAWSSAGAALAIGVATPAHAQVSNASLRGTVKAEGGVSQVTAINVNTGLTRSVAVGANGSYNIASLPVGTRSEEQTSELKSLMRISYAVLCLKKKKRKTQTNT